MYLPKFGSEFSRTKRFCFENGIFLLPFGLGICEGVGEDSGHGIGHVDCKTREISNLWKNGKIVISVKTRNFSRSRMTKRFSPLESSRKI